MNTIGVLHTFPYDFRLIGESSQLEVRKKWLFNFFTFVHPIDNNCHFVKITHRISSVAVSTVLQDKYNL